jgi:hypothetical protein
MMTAVMVDSNVLLDLMTEDARWLSRSAEAVENAAGRFRLVINPIICAEVSIRYSRIEDLEAALPKAMLDREAIPYEAAFLAGTCFLVYRQRGNKAITASGLFYRHPRVGCWVSAGDPRYCALSQLLSEAVVDRLTEPAYRLAGFVRARSPSRRHERLRDRPERRSIPMNGSVKARSRR